MWSQELSDKVKKKEGRKHKYNDEEGTQNYIAEISPSRKIITILWVSSSIKTHKCSDLIREQKLNNMFSSRDRFKMKRF